MSLDVGVGTIVASERKLNFFFKSDFSRRVVHKSGKALICNDAGAAAAVLMCRNQIICMPDRSVQTTLR